MTRAAAQIEGTALHGPVLLADRPQQRFRGEKRRVREAMEKVGALGVATQKPERFAIRPALDPRPGGVLCQEHAKALAASRIVGEAQESEQRLVGPALVEGVQCMPRRLVGHHYGDAGDDGKGAALATEHARVDAGAPARQRVVLDDRDRSAAIGAPQDVQEARVPAGISCLEAARGSCASRYRDLGAEAFEEDLIARADLRAPVVFGPEQPRRVSFTEDLQRAPVELRAVAS